MTEPNGEYEVVARIDGIEGWVALRVDVTEKRALEIAERIAVLASENKPVCRWRHLTDETWYPAGRVICVKARKALP